MMIPIMMNTVLIVTPQEKHGSAMGVCMCVISLYSLLSNLVCTVKNFSLILSF